MRAATTVRTSAIVAMTVATVIGFVRVFDTPAFLGPLLGVAVAAHLCAALTRHRPVSVSTPVMVLAGAVVCIATTHWSSTTYGIPTPATFAVIGQNLSDSVEVLRTTAAPVTPDPGVLLVVAFGLWIAAWSADRLCFVYAAPAEAVVPTATLFVIVTALAGRDHRWVPVGLYAAAVAVHLLVDRHLGNRAETGGDETTRVWRPILRGAGVAGVAIIAGLTLAATVPALQFAGAKPIRQDRTIEVTPPLIDLHDQLVDPDGTEMFRVQGGGSHYWRLGAYDTFDGSRWLMSASRSKRVDGELPSNATQRWQGGSESATSTFDLTGLGGTFAPAAFLPSALEGPLTRSQGRAVPQMRWDPENFALVVGHTDGGVDGLSYTVTSNIPAVTQDELRAANGDLPEEVERFTDLPDDIADILVQKAESIVGDAPTRFDIAHDLQNYFRSGDFEYSTDLRDVSEQASGESTDAILTFLDHKVGYCVHFAGTYAALARAMGLPARVAVGFTPGEFDPVHGQYIVRGRNAHVWPEVFFPGLGWVPFEPSPGRGNPDAEPYTDVTGVPDPNRPSETSEDQAGPTTTAPAQLAPTTTAAPRSESTAPDATESSTRDASASAGESGPGRTLLLVVALLVVPIFAGRVIRSIRRSRRRRVATDPAGRVRLAWTDTLDAWHPLDLERSPSETDRDLGNRLAGRLRILLGEKTSAIDAHRLAELATTAAWNAPGITPDDVTEARTVAERLVRIAHDNRAFASRILGWFDPRYRGGN